MRQFFPLILFVIAVLGTFFYTKPLYSDVQVALSERASYLSAIADAQKLDQKIADLNTIKNNFAPADLDRLNKMLPEKVDNVRLVIEINQIAKKYSPGVTNIHIGTPAISAPQAGGAVATSTAVDLSFSVTTSYTQFLNFLQDLQSNLRITDVTTLSFTPVDTGAAYTFNMSIKTYGLQ